MKDLANMPFEEVCDLYTKYFSLGHINSDVSDKLAIISLTCYITNAIRKKGKNVSCYDVLLKVVPGLGDFEKNTFLKGLSALCQDLMYDCNTFPDFGIEPKKMPEQLRQLIYDKYCPF